MRHHSKSYIVFSTTMLLAFSAVIITPFVITIMKSLELRGFGNYTRFMNQYNIFPYFWNSVIVCVATIAVILTITTLAAFSFSKLKFPFKGLLFQFLLCALMLPPATILMPVYNTVRMFGMLNSRFAIILPYVAIIAPMDLLMLKSQMDEIPNEIMEAARIDGCKDFRFFYSVAVPLCKPSIVVVIIWTFISTWNEYLLAVILFQTPKYHTITLFPSYFQNDYTRLDEPSRFAAYVCCMLPILLIYVLLRKYIEKGFIATGAVKG